ncbi:hypothetical protein MASR2M78_27270 [Treponema sp.]
MAIIRKKRKTEIESETQDPSRDQGEFDLAGSEATVREDLQPSDVKLEAESEEDSSFDADGDDDDTMKDRASNRLVVRTRIKKRPLRVELVKENGVEEEREAVVESAVSEPSEPSGDNGPTPLSHPVPSNANVSRHGRRPFEKQREGASGGYQSPPRPSPVSNAAAKLLPPMPDIYGKPEPRGDQDNGKPRLSINELTRSNMIDLRELAGRYGISHEDMVALKKQEIIFHTQGPYRAWRHHLCLWFFGDPARWLRLPPESSELLSARPRRYLYQP